MSIRTDLAVEGLDFAEQTMPLGIKGVERSSEVKNGLKITRVKITSEDAGRAIGKGVGEYITVETSDFKLPTADFNGEIETVAEVLASIIRKDERGVLVVGLGNKEITPDALGPIAVSYILATRHISRELQEETGLLRLTPVSAIATGVLGQTGIETAEIVASVVRGTNPSCVIVIDALASKCVDRLASTIQISNAGIAPGSGVQNKRRELSEKTLGVPVVSIGVPMVVDMATIAYDMLGAEQAANISDKGKAMMVTPREIDLAVEHAGRLVGFAINKALQPNISLEDLYALVG